MGDPVLRHGLVEHVQLALCDDLLHIVQDDGLVPFFRRVAAGHGHPEGMAGQEAEHKPCRRDPDQFSGAGACTGSEDGGHGRLLKNSGGKGADRQLSRENSTGPDCLENRLIGTAGTSAHRKTDSD